MKNSSWQWLQDKYNITAERAAVVEWRYGYCGGFRKALWWAITLADEDNLIRIGRGFPVEVSGFIKYKEVKDWWQEVEKACQDNNSNEEEK